MSNLEKRKETVPATEEPNYFEAYGDAATSRPIEGDLLKFVQGEFFAGRENRDVPHGTRLVVDMKTLQVGWQFWQDGRPGEPKMGLVAEGFQPEKRSALGYLDKTEWETDAKGASRDPYQFSNMVVMREASDVVYTFATSSRGGLDAVGELSKAYGKRIRQHPDELPVIELDSSSYQHPDRSIGRVKTPVFKLVGWVDKDGSPVERPAATKPATAQPRF